jgi:hypothetical protein
MKQITVEETIYKTVKAGKKSKIQYETRDGEKFNTEKQALDHEKNLDYLEKFDKIQKITIGPNFDFLPAEDIWYYLADQEQLDTFIINISKYNYCSRYFNGKVYLKEYLKIGDWVTLHYLDGGNSRDTLDIYTLDFVKNEIFDFMLNFSNEEKNAR